ncbi:MAG: hypothetical protein JW832_18030 [Deltaproteobacteria bacterium]|nr:hypothetical protein [Deltaproteobacteria bacterium]
MHEELAALEVFFDPLSVAAALKDALDARTPEITADQTPAAMRIPGPAAVDDHDMLRRLLPQELYGFWRDAGYTGIYCMTFLLRHAVTFIALLAHERACQLRHEESRTGPAAFLKRHFPRQYETSYKDCLEALCCLFLRTQPGPGLYVPVLGFSSLGVHLLYRETGICRAFDYYDICSCANRSDGLFCSEHTSEEWWCEGAPKGSTQADMFRFYGARENIHQYDEQQLQELVGRFWTHFKRAPHMPKQGEAIVEEALDFFRFATLHECCQGGLPHLRKRYTERARALHPDAGGEHASFVQLQKYYEVLRACIQYERAGLF